MKFEIEKRIIDFNPEVFLNNYHDEKLWETSFTIFTYRDYTFTIKLNTIYTYDRSLAVNVRGENGNGDARVSSFFIYLNNDSTELKKLIDRRLISAVKSVISGFETDEIYKTERYKSAKREQEKNRKNLEEIAEKFLDDESITNEKIRKYYIDGFLKEHWKSFAVDIVREMKFNLMTDLYYAWLKFANDKEKLEYFLKEEVSLYDTTKVDNEIKEYREYLESENLLTDLKESYENMKEEE